MLQREDGVAEAASRQLANGSARSVKEAEDLIASLTGVLSARIVTSAAGEVEEVHVLTTEEISPKLTVRNVESALRAHFDLRLDHRKISVAQTSRESAENSKQEPENAAEPEVSMPLFVERQVPAREGRILFLGYRSDAADGHRTRFTVALEWSGERVTGEATGPTLPRLRADTIATATLRAVEGALGREAEEVGEREISLVLDGVKIVEISDRQFALVAVHALAGRQIVQLSGSAPVGESQDHAVILATLKATDRWVRGQV